MMTLLVIDMQVGSFDAATPQHDADRVVSRINRLAAAVRKSGGVVVFVQHDGPPGETFEPGAEGWQLLPTLERAPADRLVNKRACDAFYETDLQRLLDDLGTDDLLICGSATDYCVDTTVRAAASLDYAVTVVRDGHTCSDRPYMNAAIIREHHNAVWEDLVLPRAKIHLVTADELVERLHASGPTVS